MATPTWASGRGASGARWLGVIAGLVVVHAGGCRDERARALPALTRETLPAVKAAFNAGGDGPRAIVFFSSACAACDTGSAALQEMLATVDARATVLAVWEPIDPADPAPTGHMLANLVDPRVHQLWDPDHLISDEMRAAELADPASPPQARTRTDSRPDGIMYDTVAVFSPGARWEATLPAARYLEVGLAAKLGELREQLAARD